MNWEHKVKIRHLLTVKEDYESIQKSMNEIADVIDNDHWFLRFRSKGKFRNIPKGDEYFKPVDYANRLLEKLWDFCDAHRIWVEF
jgi:hypothetical protein